MVAAAIRTIFANPTPSTSTNSLRPSPGGSATNPLAEQEVERRADVVGVFPNPDALLRLAGGAVLVAALVAVTRAMAAGAHAYLTPGTLGDLAAEVRVIVEGRDDRALSYGSRHRRAVPELEAET